MVLHPLAILPFFLSTLYFAINYYFLDYYFILFKKLQIPNKPMSSSFMPAPMQLNIAEKYIPKLVRLTLNVLPIRLPSNPILLVYLHFYFLRRIPHSFSPFKLPQLPTEDLIL